MRKACLVSIFFLSSVFRAQVNPYQIGAWYANIYTVQFKENPFGVQGDIQYRNWNLGGDLEQLLIRSGITYKFSKANLKVTAGCVHVTNGAFGGNNTVFYEVRPYQELLFPHTILKRVGLLHRIRAEQRFIDGQDFRTRYRYAFTLNLPFNKQKLEKNALYFSLYDELFINGETDIGGGRKVDYFDRNRGSVSLGYCFSASFRFQFGIMRQTTTFSKDQFVISLIETF